MSAASLGVGEHVTTGTTQYSIVSGNNYERILKNGRECVTLSTLGHTPISFKALIEAPYRFFSIATRAISCKWTG